MDAVNIVKILEVFEGQMLRKLFLSACVVDDFRLRTNQELAALVQRDEF